MNPLVANARMYAVTPGVEAVWRAVLLHAGTRAGIPLAYRAHPAPAPLDALWARDDLGLAFLCGYPFAREVGRWQAVAAPVRVGNGPVYATDLVARADGPIASLEKTFGRRVGWTTPHSQSGYQALRHHLLPHRRETPLFAASVGPLVTPRRVIEALVAGDIDLGPLDSLWHALLRRHEPGTAARLRVVATTEPAPIPLLVASRGVPEEAAARLRAALVGLAGDPGAAPHLATLGLEGFAAVAPGDYAVLVERARAADAAGYPAPA